MGFDRDAETLNLAHELGACDEIASSVAGVARGADIIVVGVPLGELEAVFSEIAATGLDENVTVTDICSVKRLPVRLGQRFLGPRFVGGHPMAGSEKSGVIASNADLLPRATWFLTPTAGTSESALAEVARLVRSIGARPVLTGPEAHDRIVASVSHLPYLVSVALLHSVLRNRGSVALGVTGRSLRDMTRVAASKPDFWMPVLEANRNEVVDSLDGLIVDLSSLREAIARGAREELFPYLEEAQELRAVTARSHDRSPPGWSREREFPPAPQLPAPFPVDDEGGSSSLVAEAVEAGSRGSPIPVLERAAAKRISLRAAGSPLGPM